MAKLRPEFSRALTLGQYREAEMLRMLADVLPGDVIVYHGLKISHFHDASQRFGELDAVVAFPQGHVAVLEIKAGDVDLSERGIFKRYGGKEKNLAHQAHAQLHGLIGRLREMQLDDVRVAHFLLLPDFKVSEGSIGFPRGRIIDASQIDQVAALLADACRHMPLPQVLQQRLHDFLSNRFSVVPDVAFHRGQRQTITRHLSEGLATWVPRVTSPGGLYVVDATAGSGKTQLALTLLQEADRGRLRARYVCFNRPLADHIARLAPVRVEVSTADELGIAALRATGEVPDFHNDATVFVRGREALRAANAEAEPTLDLLIIDESQDFDHRWLETLLPCLKPQGRLYVMGDTDQAIYRKEPFDLPEATRIVCRDNFRSPRRIVDSLNVLRLTTEPIVGKGPDAGEPPSMHVFAAADDGGLKATEAVVAQALNDGFSLEDIVLVSLRGRQRSRLLQVDRLGLWALRRFTGAFDNGSNTVWTPGDLLAESVYRFKGQSSPVVIVCEMDFEVLDEQHARMLFVAATRAQSQLHFVMSSAAEAALAARLSVGDTFAS